VDHKYGGRVATSFFLQQSLPDWLEVHRTLADREATITANATKAGLLSGSVAQGPAAAFAVQAGQQQVTPSWQQPPPMQSYGPQGFPPQSGFPIQQPWAMAAQPWQASPLQHHESLWVAQATAAGWQPPGNMSRRNVKPSRPPVICDSCGAPGHIWKKCAKRPFKYPWMADYLAHEQARRGESHDWLVDSGASMPICNDYNVMHSMRTAPGWHVTCANGQRLDVEGIGCADIVLSNGTLSLSNVLFVPRASVSLLSVASLDAAGLVVRFADGACHILLGTELLHVAPHSAGQYTVSAPPCVGMAMVATPGVPAATWHRRLGHACHDRLTKLVKHNMAHGIDVQPADMRKLKDEFCEACTLSKLRRAPFRPSDSVSHNPLQLLHTDLAGPFSCPTPEGALYLLAVLDDFSKYGWVRMLRLKSDAAAALQHLIRQCETQLFPYRVQKIRSDKGGEFTGATLLAAYAEKGIVPQTTVGYAPPQNGAAERFLQSIISAGRTMHHDAALPPEQWGISMSAACWVHNRMPHAGTGNKTPYELLFRCKPDLSKLKVYGSPAFAVVPRHTMRKVGAGTLRAQPGRYMGVGSAGILFLPDGGRKCVEHQTVHVIESDAPLFGGLWAKQAADVAAKHPCPWPVKVPPGLVHHGREAKTPAAPATLPAFALPSVPRTPAVAPSHVPAPPSTELLPATGSPTAALLPTPAVASLPTTAAPAVLPSSVALPPASGSPAAALPPATGPPTAMLPPAGALSPTTPVTAVRRSGRPHKPPVRFDPTIAAQEQAARERSLRDASAQVATAVVRSRKRRGGRRRARAAVVQACPLECNAPLVAPSTTEEALAGPAADLWREAMAVEYQKLSCHGTFEVETPPPGTRLVGSKWVYAIKRDSKGNIIELKARLVATGFSQRAGIDYTELFAPVGKYTTFRVFHALVAGHGLQRRGYDVPSAFLKGDQLAEVVYMKPPPGFACRKGEAWRLLRPLYGLKQAPRAWEQALRKELESWDMVSSDADCTLYTTKGVDGPVFMCTYVDDFDAGGSDRDLDVLEARLKAKFNVKRSADDAPFVGMQRERDASGAITVHQQRYTEELLSECGMSNAKPVRTPMQPGAELRRAQPNDPPLGPEIPFAKVLGKLMFLAGCTRVDIMRAVNGLARHMSDPRESHWHALRWLLRYLRGTSALGLRYLGPPPGGVTGNTPAALPITGYADADYASCKDTRRSTTGQVFIMSHGKG
jgi:hypothetical protein